MPYLDLKSIFVDRGMHTDVGMEFRGGFDVL